MKITRGAQWVINCTPNYQESVAFFRDVLGLVVEKEGVPVTDTQFSRYTQFKLPNELVLEIVEPTEAVAHLYTSPIVSMTVEDLDQAYKELEDMELEFVSPIFHTNSGWGWSYFRAPDNNVYQIQGPYGD